MYVIVKQHSIHQKYVGVFAIYLHTTFCTPSSNGLLVIANEEYAKKFRIIAIFLFFILQKIP
jgi:hypothetical protein